MKRYAFIDVQNTQSTTQTMLGFSVDWMKLSEYLKNNKSCTEVFLYTGIENGDIETANEFDILSKTECCVVRSKTVFIYKNKDKTSTIRCPYCQKESIQTVPMGYRKKSNCDVELSVDVIEKSGPDNEIFLFTGDGDFEYLIRRSLEKGAQRIYLCSYAGKEIKAGITESHYSTKLRKLVDEKKERVFYVSLRDLRDRIKKST
ncbi:MAG: NYN domain-containing protein [Candidatus Paceibacterota bacterium]|jgi:uncharacterized LabA/DUF88 family protein